MSSVVGEALVASTLDATGRVLPLADLETHDAGARLGAEILTARPNDATVPWESCRSPGRSTSSRR